MKKITYISTFIPRGQLNYIESFNRNYNFNSADAFSYSLFCGFKENLGEKFYCINIPPIGAFPRYNRMCYYNNYSEYDGKVKVDSIGFSTIYQYMYFSIYLNFFKKLKNDFVNSILNVFVVYSINIPVIKALIDFRRKYLIPFKIILIIPDFLEDYMNESFTSRLRLLLSVNVDSLYKEMDGFVFLTENMRERIPVDRPYCVVEGVYNQLDERSIIKIQSQKKVIFYSGLLLERFGVKNLVDAFLNTSDSSYSLQICGCGELESYIIEKSKQDQRIKFLGLIPRKEVLELQKNATLLINPRQPIQDFTKYSFPSKNIEYMASGTPVLIYELEGIPKEYYNYCFHLSNQELLLDDLVKKIVEILNYPQDCLKQLAERAAKFIIEEKSACKQARKILDLIDNIS